MDNILAVGKFILEILKNWRFIAPLFALLASYSGWSTYDNNVKAEELAQTQEQVREISKHYTKTIIVNKCNCSGLESRIDKLERWH